VPAKSRIVPVLQPSPLPALAPQIRDAAVTDIQCLDVAQGMNGSDVFSILEDSQGQLWFGNQSGVSRYDPDDSSFTYVTREEGLSSNIVFSMMEDSRGNIWFGTWGGGLTRYDGRQFTFFTTEEGLSNNYIRSVLEDDSKNIWLSTNYGCIAFSR
jgi:streptogramin lyase